MNHNNNYDLSGAPAGPGATKGMSTAADAATRAAAAPRFATRELVLAALFAAVTAVLAYVRIPLPISPVPVTGQTFGFMLAGVLLGPRLGALSMVVYVLMGVAGLPVFAGGAAGIGVLVGPTGGYLWGGIAGAYVAGLVTAGRGRLSLSRALFGTVLGGIAAVYGIGVLQLGLVTGMGWREALVAGVVPFLIGDGLKAVTAAVLAVRLLRVVGDRHS